MEKLLDNKNKEVKINCTLRLGDGRILYAGEKGSLRVDDLYLQSATNNHGYLSEIVAACELTSGDIVVATLDCDLIIYSKSKNFIPFRIIHNIKDDTIYNLFPISSENIKSNKSKSFIASGDKNINYRIRIVY